MGRLTRLIVLMSAVLFGAAGASAETRVALVIGNGKYQNVSLLPNPANDSADVAAALKRLGFDVRTLTDAKYDDMRRALLEFDRRAVGSDIAVVFFAGHGMEVGGQNWLIPVDAELSTDTAAENEALSLRTVMEKVGKARRLGLVILDACRNNPFAAKMELSTYKRAVERGFGRVEPAGNVLVAYAAKDGTTANDGSGRNSPFTAALLKNIEMPNIEIEMMFRLVRDEVIQSTKGGQLPFKYGSLSGQAIYLKRNAAEEAKDPLPVGDPAALAWAAAQNTSSVEVLEEFVRRYGDSFYAALAKARLTELKKQVALNVPVPPSSAASSAPALNPCAGNALSASLTSRAPCGLSASQERALKPSEAFRECDACPEMVVVPEGTFMMGKWKKQVSFARPFAVAKFHVTVAQFAAFRGETGYAVENNPGRFGRSCTAASLAPGAPVGCLSWDDAQAYVDWLTKKTGKAYRFLSEAEFAYAANSRFLEFAANDWLADCFHRYSGSDYSAAPTDGSVWAGGDCGEHLEGSQYGSSSSRASMQRGSELSFRVARTLAR